MTAPAQRLAIVLSHPVQYYSPWFRWLRAHAPLTFRVFYLSDSGIKQTRDEKFQRTFAWDVDLTTGYDWEVVPNTARVPDTLRFSGLCNPELPDRLAAWNPTAILLFGYKYRTHLNLIVWARRRGIPLIFRGDSHLLGRTAGSLLRDAALTLLYRQFAAVTFVGQANREYFSHFRVPAKRLFFAPHAVDTSLFDPTRSELAPQAAALRESLGLPAKTRVVLFAGKLIPSKQPLALLQAFLALERRATALVFVGDGPEKPALEAAAQAAGDRIRFLPFANQSEMPARYFLADLFVLPSRGAYETWGLAVNEAMQLGVPCLVSDQVGCQRDLVTDGETGWVFRADEPDALQPKLAQALDTPIERFAEIRRSVAKRIGSYSYARTSEGLLAALASLSAA